MSPSEKPDVSFRIRRRRRLRRMVARTALTRRFIWPVVSRAMLRTAPERVCAPSSWILGRKMMSTIDSQQDGCENHPVHFGKVQSKHNRVVCGEIRKRGLHQITADRVGERDAKQVDAGEKDRNVHRAGASWATAAGRGFADRYPRPARWRLRSCWRRRRYTQWNAWRTATEAGREQCTSSPSAAQVYFRSDQSGGPSAQTKRMETTPEIICEYSDICVTLILRYSSIWMFQKGAAMLMENSHSE